jgi:hypothetical protein
VTIVIPADRAHLVADTMSEKQLQEHVRKLCRDLGLFHYHSFDSRRSEPGFPDSVICKKGLLYRELKSQTGRLSLAQIRTGRILAEAGADWKTWRPQDLIDGTIMKELQEIA